ncbi:hypothetical protein [Paraburkholderia sp. HD33-4]|uniref:hypothetical protein n=1 Tax=Paraburkholderia sp. HD33-4 TaxID=2883242 RepID=UPI001F30FB43|nr:hypothetical protein [Paraburkholderia sp. HD33-4]
MASKGNQKQVQPQPNQRTPGGNWNANGTSQGKSTGAVRPTPDACNEKKGSK